eukprot:30641-Eustigmatos_ZCMA.PRE.1
MAMSLEGVDSRARGRGGGSVGGPEHTRVHSGDIAADGRAGKGAEHRGGGESGGPEAHVPPA